MTPSQKHEKKFSKAVSLLRSGAFSAGQLAKKLKVTRPTAYKILEDIAHDVGKLTKTEKRVGKRGPAAVSFTLRRPHKPAEPSDAANTGGDSGETAGAPAPAASDSTSQASAEPAAVGPVVEGSLGPSPDAAKDQGSGEPNQPADPAITAAPVDAVMERAISQEDAAVESAPAVADSTGS